MSSQDCYIGKKERKMMLKLIIGLCITAMNSLAWAGGVSGGGGGGTTNPDPTSTTRIAATLAKNGVILRLWLNKEEAEYFYSGESQKSAERDLLKVFFGSDRDVYSAIVLATVHMKMHESCFDLDGKPTDGSFDPAHPNDICISPFSMAPKLNEYNVDKESVGLLVHEFAHMMGANEKQAIGLQKMALKSLIFRDIPEMYSKAQLAAWDSEGVFSSAISSVLDLIDRNGYIAYDAVGQLIDGALPELDRLVKTAPDVNQDYFLNHYGMSVLDAQRARLDLISSFVCTTDDTLPAEQRSRCKSYLENVFSEEPQITARQWEIRFGSGDPGPIYDGIVFMRIRDTEGLQSELMQLKQSFEMLQLQLQEVSRILNVRSE
jgi:hypothetical protein